MRIQSWSGLLCEDHELADRGRERYFFGFCAPFRMRFTKDWGIRKFRAMAARFSPALKDARTRFAFASGILQSVQLRVVQVFEGARQVAWKRDRGGQLCLDRWDNSRGSLQSRSRG